MLRDVMVVVRCAPELGAGLDENDGGVQTAQLLLGVRQVSVWMVHGGRWQETHASFALVKQLKVASSELRGG